MVRNGEVDAGCRGSGFWVVGLLVNLRLFLALSTISPLSVELNGFILPDLEGRGDWIHRVDPFFDSFDESFLEHLSKSDVVMATESRVFLEVLNILFGGIGGHSDILELGPSGGGGIRVAETGLKLMDEVEEGEERGIRDVDHIGNLFISC